MEVGDGGQGRRSGTEEVGDGLGSDAGASAKCVAFRRDCP
jgi:hypothetical protein